MTEVQALERILKSRTEIKPLRRLRYGAKRLYQDHRSEYNKLYAYANNVDVVLQVLVDVAETGYVAGDEVVFIAPASRIKQGLRDYSIWKEEEQIRATMKKLVCRGGFIRHVNDAELRERFPKMFDYLETIQGKDRRTHCSVYAMPLNRTFDDCLTICIEAEDNRRKSGATGPVTQDSSRLLGADVHDALYQTPRGTSARMDRLLKKFRPALRLCLEENGYVTRELVLQYCGESTNPAMRKLREAWPRLLQDEELVEIRVNKAARRIYGLPAELESNKKIAVLKEGVDNGENPAVSIIEAHQNRTIEWNGVCEEDQCGCVGSAPVSHSPCCGAAEAGGTLERQVQAASGEGGGGDRALVSFKRRGIDYETSGCEARLIAPRVAADSSVHGSDPPLPVRAGMKSLRSIGDPANCSLPIATVHAVPL
jgi:hypothetical protein